MFPENAFQEIDIPTKAEVFLTMAYVLSSLSKDAQTHCGCIITDAKHRIIGGGYNSFPMGCPDHELPNTRPYKYPYVIHAESNALAFCTTRPEGATVYITVAPCLECIKRMWQEGISRVVYCDTDYSYSCPEDKQAKEILTNICPIQFDKIKPNMDFLLDLVIHLKGLDFISEEALQKLKN